MDNTKELKSTFDFYDKDGDGILDRNDMRDLLISTG